MQRSRAINIYKHVWVNGNVLNEQMREEINEAIANDPLKPKYKNNLSKVLHLCGFFNSDSEIPTEFIDHVRRDLSVVGRMDRKDAKTLEESNLYTKPIFF
jgi:hypothetical protein